MKKFDVSAGDIVGICNRRKKRDGSPGTRPPGRKDTGSGSTRPGKTGEKKTGDNNNEDKGAK
jgi:hypothetical protein